MDKMDKRKMYFISLSAGIAVMSVVSVLVQLFWQIFDNYGGLAIVLLRMYIILTGVNFLEIYIRPRIVKRHKFNNVIINSIVLSTVLILISVEQPVGLWIQMVLDIVSMIISILIVILFYVVKYFVQKAYTKRMNKKLDEYKQKNDDILEK